MNTNTQKTIKGFAKISTFFCGPPIGFYQTRKLYWSWNNGPIEIKSPSNEPIRNKEDHQVIWQRTRIKSHMFFHNWGSSLKFGNQQRLFFLDLDPSIFIKMFEFYLVTKFIRGEKRKRGLEKRKNLELPYWKMQVKGSARQGLRKSGKDWRREREGGDRRKRLDKGKGSDIGSYCCIERRYR